MRKLHDTRFNSFVSWKLDSYMPDTRYYNIGATCNSSLKKMGSLQLLDEFSEKFRVGGGVISDPKKCIAISLCIEDILESKIVPLF